MLPTLVARLASFSGEGEESVACPSLQPAVRVCGRHYNSRQPSCLNILFRLRDESSSREE